jgi:anti-sigma regulatory factor (Ser/Thr protein kinase)
MKGQGMCPSCTTCRPAGPRSRTRIFPPHLDQLSLIREFVEEIAAPTSLGSCDTYNLKLAVSEASANAIEHGVGQGDLKVSASRRRDRITFTVCHPGAFLPRIGNDPARADRGMGLPLMLALTDELRVSRPPGGGTRVTLSVFLG